MREPLVRQGRHLRYRPSFAKAPMRKQRSKLVIYDPKKIFAVAEEFQRATTALVAAQFNAPLITPYIMMQSPSVVVAAFSLELYLKCLFVMDHSKQPPQNHDLKAIFDKLAADTKREIAARFDPAQGQSMIDDIRRRNPNGVFWSIPKTFTLDYAILASSKAFEHARYAYERARRPTEQWCGSPIVDAARQLILERHPGWENAVMRQAEIRLSPRASTRSSRKPRGR